MKRFHFFSFVIDDEKIGVCPYPDHDKEKDCPPPESLEGCLLDSDCSGSKKCCSNGCNLACTAVQVVNTTFIIPPETTDEPHTTPVTTSSTNGKATASR